jgi:hypothetical protein
VQNITFSGPSVLNHNMYAASIRDEGENLRLEKRDSTYRKNGKGTMKIQG